MGEPVGHEAGFVRPALVVSEDRMSETGLVVVLPITSTRLGYATHVEIDGALPVPSYVQCEQITVLSTHRVRREVGHVDAVEMLAVERVLRQLLALG